MAKKAYIGVETTLYPNSVSELAVGSTVKINENGSPVEYLIVHQGNPDASFYDASCDGTWVLRKDIYTDNRWDSSNNDYANSDAHTYLNGSFLALLDSSVQQSVKQVKIPYVKGSGSSTVGSGSNGLSAKVFYLSAYEVGWTSSTSSYITKDGACLTYFMGATDSKREAWYSYGETGTWWLRSPRISNTAGVSVVGQGGGYENLSYASNLGCRPALVLPSSSLLTNGVVTGAQTESVTRGVAKKVKKGYVGVDGKARKIKKAYIGIGGVARPCWSGGELEYYGTITALGKPRGNLSAAPIGDYAIFAGGYDGTAPTKYVDAYNSSLTRTTQSDISEAVYQLAATSNGAYALFGGGKGTSSSNKYGTSALTAYDAELTRTIVSKNFCQARYDLTATSVGGYALFGGGKYNATNHSKVEAFNNSLTHSDYSLSTARFGLAATTIGNYALFGGGAYNNSNDSNVVDAYDKSLTRTTPTVFATARKYHAATTVGDYALFAGGGSGGYVSKFSSVEAYDSSLTRSTPTELSAIRGYLAATSVGGYALFGGGYESSSAHSNIVDVYDVSLTRTVATSLSIGTAQHAATTIGNYALFGGGDDTAVVNAYVVD